MAACACVSFLFAFIYLQSMYLAAAFLLGITVFVRNVTSPLKALALLILIVPFSNMEIFHTRLMNIVGLKPINILFLFIVVTAIWNKRKSSPLPRYAYFFIMITGFIFGLGVLRSIPHVDLFSSALAEDLSFPRYFLTFGIRPIIYFTPFIIILKFVKNYEDVERITRLLLWTMVTLSSFLLFLYFFGDVDKTNILSARAYFGSILHMHGNDIANFYIISVPLMLAHCNVHKDKLGTIVLLLSIPVIGILCSRTAYILLFFSTIFYYIISKRTKHLPVILAVLFILFSSIAYQGIKDRALNNLYTKDSDKITAGRITIWEPLIREHLNDPVKFFFGNGRNATISSQTYQKGFIDVKHPHNMYLEQWLDNGVVGLCLIMGFLFLFLSKIRKSIPRMNDFRCKEYQYAMYTAIITYLISGLFGRSLIPQDHNAFFWVILGLSLAMIKMNNRHREEEYEKN